MNKLLSILFVLLLGICIYTLTKRENSQIEEKSTQKSTPIKTKKNLQTKETKTKNKKNISKNNSSTKLVYLSYPDEIAYYNQQIELLKKKDYGNPTDPIYQQNNNIFLNLDGEHKQITSGDDEYFMPTLSPDNIYLSYEDSTGLVIKNITDKTVKKFGEDASSLQWHPKEDIFLYLRTKDNGSILTESSIYLYDITKNSEYLIAGITDYIAINPIFSNDGNYIYFQDDKTEKIITINIKDFLNEK